MSTVWSQADYQVAFEWAASGAAQVLLPGNILVVVDVLSFTTSVSVAVERGIDVYPAVWGDDRANEFAAQVDARMAVPRSEVSPESPWSLSPSALRSAPFTPRLVLPSPNGSAIASVQREAPVAAACLRNARAVGYWAAQGLTNRDRVCVIAAGERWPEGSLRSALEDALGAGAVIAAIAESTTATLSPEADAVRAMYAASDLHDAVIRCSSARELQGSGFGGDVDVALELDASDVVPVMSGGAFRAAAN